MTFQWVDPTGPDRPTWFPDGSIHPDDIADAVAIASEILTRLTGYLVHPAGSMCEEFAGSPFIFRLTPTYRPITALTSIHVHDPEGGAGADVTDRFHIHTGNVWSKRWNGAGHRRPGLPYANAPLCRPGEVLKMCYDFGSTLTTAAEQTCWYYASQIYYSRHPDEGECLLPERVTSVSREGLSWTVIDPQQYLDNGRTGLPAVDQYISTANPSQGKRPAAVYLPEAPPGVGRV